MSIITKPGAYPGFPAEAYHGNPTPEPALSAGFAWRLLQKCPARAWYESALNPDREPEEKSHFDIGKAAHLLFLEPERYEGSIAIVRGKTKDGKPSEGYGSQDAKDQRDAARAAGKIPLLPKEADLVAGMRRALRNEVGGLPFNTAPPFADDGFRGGQAEVSYFWRSDNGIWMKARPDYRKPRVVVDYKTSATADPRELGRAAFNLGWPVRSALYLEGHKALTGEAAEYWYVIQEKQPPYLATVAKMDADSLEWGRMLLAAAKALFLKCVTSGRWPAYSEQATLIGLPSWAQYQLQDRKDRGEFDLQRYYEIAARMYAPLDMEEA